MMKKIWMKEENVVELYECINFILNRTQSAVHVYFKETLTPFDVTPIQYSLLKCLWDNDMQTPTMLAQALQMDASTVTGLIERLERKNLIAREYSVEDRRSISIRLTSEGKSLQPGVEATIQQANLEAMRGLTDEQAAAFKRACALIQENVRR